MPVPTNDLELPSAAAGHCSSALSVHNTVPFVTENVTQNGIEAPAGAATLLMDGVYNVDGVVYSGEQEVVGINTAAAVAVQHSQHSSDDNVSSASAHTTPDAACVETSMRGVRLRKNTSV
jgi:hypothetical protein